MTAYSCVTVSATVWENCSCGRGCFDRTPQTGERNTVGFCDFLLSLSLPLVESSVLQEAISLQS